MGCNTCRPARSRSWTLKAYAEGLSIELPRYNRHMILDPELVRRFENEEIRRTPADYHAGLAVFEALWEHGCKLGVLPPSDLLEGLDTVVRLAGALNVRQPS